MMKNVRLLALRRLKDKKLHTPELDSLPLSDQTTLRENKDLYVRSIIHAELKALTIYPESFTETVEWMNDSNAVKYCSPTEKALLLGASLSAADEIKYSWYSESLYSMLFVLGIAHKEFGPDQEADVERYARFIPPNQSLEKFISRIERISDVDTYVLRDEYYLLHWLCRHGKQRLNASVVVERRKAFEWICDAGVDWDDVHLDT